MKIIRAKAIKLLFVVCLSFLCFIISGKTLVSSKTITVDVSQVLSDVSNHPVGIGTHFLANNSLADNPALIVPHLKEMKIGSLRYPGEYYLFDQNNPTKPKVSIKDSSHWLIGPHTDAQGNWYKTLGFEDFMSICKSIKAEPFIIVGIDAIAYTGDAPHATPEEVLEAAVEWVKYANIIKGYNLKYWEIGNENDLENELTDWTAEKYAKTVVQFSRAMKAVDPSIKIGANAFSWTNWWDKILPIIKDDVDFLVAHQYSSMKSYQQWKNYVWNYTANIEAAREAIESYNPNLTINVTEISSRAPGADKKDPNLAKNNNWRVLHNFEIIGTALGFNQVDYVHFWTSRWLDRDDTARNAFNSSYEPMPMSIPLKIWGNFLQKQMVYASKLASIRSWATYDPDQDTLNLFLLNKDKVFHHVNIILENYRANNYSESWVLKGTTPESMDLSWQKTDRVWLNSSKVSTQLDPLSVTVIELQGSGKTTTVN